MYYELRKRSTSVAAPWAVVAGGATLTVRLTPKGGRDAIDGIERLADGRSVLNVRVRAAPSGGEANEALKRLMAKTLSVAPRDVTLVVGATARIKRLMILGDGPAFIFVLEGLAG